MPDFHQPFETLLGWLDRDRDLAGEKYETIRSGLVRIFVSKGFSDAEHLADETIDRVIKRLPDIIDTYEGQPARYFHGVARNVILEALRPKELTIDLPVIKFVPKETENQALECLDRCLHRLPLNKRDLILDYYLYQGHDKIKHHKNMAEELAITEGALRGRAHQIRTTLELCVRNCMAGPIETEPASEHITNGSILAGGRQP